jgi:hypothetical protein
VIVTPSAIAPKATCSVRSAAVIWNASHIGAACSAGRAA